MSIANKLNLSHQSKKIPRSKSTCCNKPVKTIYGANFGWCSQCRKSQDLAKPKTNKPKDELSPINTLVANIDKAIAELKKANKQL